MAHKEMTLWEHFEELRRRLVLSIVVVVVFAIAAYIYWPYLLELLKKPLGDKELVFLTVTEPFVSRVTLAIWAGLLVSFPFVLYQALAFVLPGLKKGEKVFLVVMSFFMTALFYGGIFFGYSYLLKVAIEWLNNQGAGLIKENLTVSKYISFTGLFLLASGISFETPLVVVFLAKVGLVRPIQLLKQWRVALIAILIFSAIVTPDWSVVTMSIMASVMMVLYLLGVGLSFIFAPRQNQLKSKAS